MNTNNLSKGDIVNFKDYDRIANASIEAITQKAILVKWIFDGEKTSSRWIPKSVIEDVKKNGKNYILTVEKWFWSAG